MLSKICFKSVDNYYILKDWKSKYPQLVVKEKRKSIKKPKPLTHRIKQLEDVIQYLNNKLENKEYASKLIKDEAMKKAFSGFNCISTSLDNPLKISFLLLFILT